ncbi:MAG: competence/damage-inducible protein A [Lactobacillales bacterium]|jgi:nicotinamide-nucleotide amidase|nr:competence/damage-inducible protein A [Lactobacillales bacterium]
MDAELIFVGTELLMGEVVNSNAAFLGESLASLGINVYKHTVVGDNPGRLTDALKLASERHNLIFVCGGLGPTDDDLTKETLAEFLGVQLVENAEARAKLDERFAVIGREMTLNNLRQVLVMEGGIPLANPTGLAWGTYYKKDERVYITLPGPPSEIKPMFNESVRPLLPVGDKLHTRLLRFYGIGESQLVTKIDDLIKNQGEVTIAPYAKTHEVTLRLAVKGDESKIDIEEAKILERVGEFFYGYGEDNSLEKTVVDLLREKNIEISAAESLTGGLFQSTICSVSGASEIFKGGFVTYSIEQKEKMLGIKLVAPAVSESTARLMAEGALAKTGAQIAISFTGVAGSGEVDGQPPGTVFVGLAQKGFETQVHHFRLYGGRNHVRLSAVMRGLDLIRRTIL